MTAYARIEVILIAGLGSLLTALLAYYFAAWAVVPAGLTLALLSFYRDPPRQPPTETNLILAPADGRVVEISPEAALPDGTRVLRIMVFLSVFNVHVNRSPCAGHVRATEYRRGRFGSALNSSADSENECNTISIEPSAPLPGPIRVRQIAGVLARRIVCAAKVGARLTAGQRFGMIKLGSRTEVCLPSDARWEVLVNVGDRARAGLTVLARWRTTETV